MFHVPSKIRITILVASLLLIGAMVPSSAFAASSAQHTRSHVAKAFVTVSVTNSCSVNGRQTIVTLAPGDLVGGTAANITSPDTNESNQEALVLIQHNANGSNGPFSLMVLANGGTKSFSFIATQAGQLVGCVALINLDDDGDIASGTPDHSASVTFTIVHGEG